MRVRKFFQFCRLQLVAPLLALSRRPLKYLYHSGARPLAKHSKRTSQSVFRSGIRTARLSHHHVASRPHYFLMSRVAWYKAWHEWERHKKVHYAVLAAYVLGVGFMMLNAYKITQALSDLTNSWDFTTPANYSLDSGLETSGTTARMKAQNYSTDANTKALYHFDETSGTAAADSSGNNNNGTVANGTFGAANLNNGLAFNGSTSSVTVLDSPSLSLSQQNSLEAWTKFNNNFSAGTKSHREGILDKGDYQLYYDNETGKVTYELADKNANSWTLEGGNDVNGGWDQNGKRSVNAYIKMGSNVYAGIGVDTGDAEVWKWDGTTWTLIGGGPSSVNSSWASQTFEGVYSLSTDGTNLYAGLGLSAGDAEVWKWNGSNWSKIGGDGINSGWAISTFEEVWSLDYFGGKLYAGLGSSANDAEVWEWNGTAWSKIGGDSINSGWTTSFEDVAALTNDGTNLYASLGASAGDAEVWKWNGSAWTRIGGDAVNSSWANSTFETVRSLRYFGTKLYAGLGDSSGDAEVWEWNGTAWTRIGGDAVNSSWANTTYEQVGAFAYDGTNLYAGLGTGNGDGEVWKWNGTAWTQIGGDGLNGGWSTNQGDLVNTLLYDSGTLYAGTYDSAGAGLAYTWNGTAWTQIGGDYVNNSWGFYGISAMQVMQSQGGYLYAGTGNTTGAALVFRFNGTSWQIVGGQGLNNSWAPNTYEQVISMASYGGKLYVGLGTTASSTDQDGDVWMWDGSTWTQVGGDGLNTSWNQASRHGEVDSLAAYGGYLYAGLGASSTDGEVWRYDGTNWTQIGGDSLNSGWTTYAENVYAMAVYNGELYAGLGRSAGDGEVWKWDGTIWTKVGGDAVNTSWGATATIEDIESLMPFNGKLYAGLGSSTGDATLWEYDGTNWTQIGGDDVNASWTTGTYEKVKTLAVYNGDLYAGLGNSTGDGEVWKYADGSWTKIGGNGLNNGWASTIEEVESFSPYKGKLYVGLGYSTNVDGLVYSWGNNAYLESSTASFDTNWHHVAATYDGTTMKLFIDGVQDASTTTNVLIPDSTKSLIIGSGYGGREYGKPVASFDGTLDEIRVSDTARSSFTTKPYTMTSQTITPSSSVRTSGVWHWDGFTTNESTNGGTIIYRLSDDNGTTWKYWNGTAWVTSNNTSEANSAAVINANMATFPVTFSGLKWQAILQSDGNQRVTLNSVNATATSDTTAPSTNASSITALKAAGGTTLSASSWTNGSSPYFSWTAGSDADSGVKGYCLYLGTDNTADPATTKGLLGNSPVATGGNCQFIVSGTNVDMSSAGYIATPLTTSNSSYYLRIKAIDNAGNLSATTAQFDFKFDNTPPTNPGYISGPSGFVNDKQITLSWPTVGTGAPSDPNSGLAGLQYRIEGSPWYGDSHTGTGDSGDLLTNDGSYITVDPPDYNNIAEGVNTVYFRTWDQAGNVTTTYTTATLKINTTGAPSEPQNVVATPSSNTTNAFAFSWSAPSSYVGNVNAITYCYTVNVVPSSTNCTYTSPGVTSLGAGPYATQPGTNTFYIAAKDESGNINYSSYGQINFSANTPAPGIPGNADIVDVSIKATSNWRLAITWDEPTDTGAGIASYKIYRSTDNTNFSLVGSSSSTTYIDARLSQQTYYYKVKACDSTNNCGADSTTVHLLPTGKFTSPANLVSEPAVGGITTRKATITWSTDRGSDSKIAFGTASGKYSSAEVAVSDQVSAHTVQLDNLSAGTTYYFVAKWTDEDGNIGTSQEYTFKTSPAPSIKEVTTPKVGLSNVTIQFTSSDAYKVSVLFGKSEAYGGIQTVNTSKSESTYNVDLSGLDDGAKYFYTLTSYDSEGNAYTGNVYTFTTPPRPKISNFTFQPVAGEPTSTQKVSWVTNVPSTSTITYGKVGTNGTDSLSSDLTTNHEIVIRDLEDDSEYFVLAQSRDKDGNLAVSDRQTFHTALDTRPPKISNVSVETSIRGTGAEARGQIVVSWHTDELSTSQVAYAEGSGATVFNSKTAEDSGLSFEHIVIVSDLPTSKVYSVQPISRDKSGNAGTGDPQSAIIGRASDSVLTIVINTLRKVFGL